MVGLVLWCLFLFVRVFPNQGNSGETLHADDAGAGAGAVVVTGPDLEPMATYVHLLYRSRRLRVGSVSPVRGRKGIVVDPTVSCCVEGSATTCSPDRLSTSLNCCRPISNSCALHQELYFVPSRGNEGRGRATGQTK